MIRKTIATAAAGVAVALGGGAAYADTSVDIEAWAKQHEAEIKFFVGLDVDQCEGLKDLSYEGAVSLADARDIDLDALVEKADADEILQYVDDQGITLSRLRALLKDFCQGEIPVPSPTGSASGTGAGSGSSSPSPVDEPEPSVSSSPSEGSEASTGAASPPAADPGGSLADTGGMSPWVPIGASSALVGSGAGIFAVLRRRGIL